MLSEFSRTELLLGSQSIKKLNKVNVAVFGVGGVGGYVVEALARSGIGGFELIDNDTVSLTNINRQIIALHSTLGLAKVQVMKQRILDINPKAKVITRQCFFLPENKDDFDFKKYDYVIDAVDTVTAKLQIIIQAKEAGTKVISSMGAGNKLNPCGFEVSDIYKTSVCPLARVMRQECKKRGIKDLKVVYSREKPIKSCSDVPGSTAFVPSVAGLIIASEVIKDLLAQE